MHKTLALSSVAAVLAFAGPTLAQAPAAKSTTTTTAPAASSTTTTTTAQPSSAAPASGATTSTQTAPSAAPASGTDASANAGASAAVMSGMSVKDNTGALIGEVKAVKGAVATIAMGSDTFNVDTDKLGVKDGVASINATQAEIKKMLPAKK